MTIYESMIKDGAVFGSSRTGLNKALYTKYANDYNLWGSTLPPEAINEKLLGSWLNGGDSATWGGLGGFKPGQEIGVVKLKYRRGDLIDKLNPLDTGANVMNRIKVYGYQAGSSWANVPKNGLAVSQDAILQNVRPILGSSKSVANFYAARNSALALVLGYPAMMGYVVAVPTVVGGGLFLGLSAGHKVYTYIDSDGKEKKVIMPDGS